MTKELANLVKLTTVEMGLIDYPPMGDEWISMKGFEAQMIEGLFIEAWRHLRNVLPVFLHAFQLRIIRIFRGLLLTLM